MGGLHRNTRKVLTEWTWLSGTGAVAGIVPAGSRAEVAVFQYTSSTANHSGILRDGANVTNLWWVNIAANNGHVDCSWTHPLVFDDGLSISVSAGVGKWALCYRLVDTPA
jgi:hypothetical protein